RPGQTEDARVVRLRLGAVVAGARLGARVDRVRRDAGDVRVRHAARAGGGAAALGLGDRARRAHGAQVEELQAAQVYAGVGNREAVRGALVGRLGVDVEDPEADARARADVAEQGVD